MGRKKLAPGQAKTEQIQIRVAPPTKGWLERYARFKDTTVTELFLGLVVRAARRDKFEPPPE